MNDADISFDHPTRRAVTVSTGLTGTVALITGATSGIGKAAAFALAGRGAHVLVGSRNAARGEAVAASLRQSRLH
jgi:NAD(P)-dependent dehydrogenase (short-subunit alcohol dehydrogenase family)